MFFPFWAKCIKAEIIESGDSVTIIGDGELSQQIVGSIGIINKMKYVTVSGNFQSVGAYAFQSCATLIKVVLPDSITSFERNCFFECSSLSQLTIPANLRFIRGLALMNLPIQGNLTFPKTLEVIDGWSISGLLISTLVFTNTQKCSIGQGNGNLNRLTKIDFGESIVELGYNAFHECRSLLSLEIGPNVVLSSNSFQSCTNLKSVTVSPLNEKYYSLDNVVYSKDNLTIVMFLSNFTDDFIIHESTQTVGSCGFGYSNAKSVNLLNVVTLLNQAFEFSNVQKIIFNKLETIGGSCFSGSFLRTLKLPSTLKKIGSGAFKSCTSLTDINIPDNVESIGDGIFAGCTKLQNIIFSQNHPLVSKDSESNILYNKDQSMFIFVPVSVMKVVVPVNVTQIPAFCFLDCANLTSINFLGKITSFGESCFERTGFEIFYIPVSLKTFGERSFKTCPNLKTVIFPANSSCTSITNYVFQSCKKLEMMEFGENSIISSFGLSDFESCNFETFIIPPKVTLINGNCFNANRRLRSITLQSISELKIDPKCFTNCPLTLVKIDTITVSQRIFSKQFFLETIQITNKVVRIDALAFSDNPKLQTILFEENSSLKFISSNAFARCDLLVVVYLPKTISSITTSVFTGCSNLVWVEVNDSSRFTTIDGVLYNAALDTLILCPAGLVECKVNEMTVQLGPYAFSGCLKLGIIYLSSQISSFSDYCFEDCISLKTLNIPSSLRKIGVLPFKGCSSLKSIFYCGNSDGGIENPNINLIPVQTKFYVNQFYLGEKDDTKFFDKDVIVSNSVDPFKCPLEPTNIFSRKKSMKTRLRIFNRLSLTFFIRGL